MNHVSKKFFVTLLALALCAGGAWAAEGGSASPDGTLLLRGEEVYRVEGGRQRLLKEALYQSTDTEAGTWSWVLVDPDNEGMEGLESGVWLFLGDDERPAGFLPMHETRDYMLEFSPSGEKVLMSCGTGPSQDMGLYLLDAAGRNIVKKASFTAWSNAFWVDPHRFVFTAFDKDKGLRRGSQERGWCSVALYDTGEEMLTVIREATATRNYIVNGCDHNGEMLDVWEHSVKDEKDWADEDKIEYKGHKVPVPAAG